MRGFNKLKNKKRLLYLTFSASSSDVGFQVMLVEIKDGEFSLIHERISNYPGTIVDMIRSVNTENIQSASEIALLDRSISEFVISVTQSVINSVQSKYRDIDLIIFNALSLWCGFGSDNNTMWNMTVGDPGYISYELNIPVFSEIIRESIINTNRAILPIIDGDIAIAKSVRLKNAIFINIGKITHLSIIDENYMPIFCDNIAPGTGIIDYVSSNVKKSVDSFDRDGKMALSGKVNIDIIEKSEELRTGIIDKDIAGIKKILNGPLFGIMSAEDRISTITAFVALYIYKHFTENNQLIKRPEVIYLSGGGVKNIALVEFLANYFNPVKLESIDKLGVIGNNRMPLSLTLSIDKFIKLSEVYYTPELKNKKAQIGRFYGL